MSAARTGRAVVSLPALDLRHEPRHAAELGSQLLLGETVRVLGESRDHGWVRVRNDADGYTGWVRGWGLVLASAARIAGWQRLARGRLALPMVLARTGPGRGASVSPLFLGNRFIAGRARGGWCPVELPDGRRGFVPADALAGRARPELEQRIATLYGVPYLWGGRTPAGYDCSAFVQQVLLEQGCALPRDARQQFRSSAPIRVDDNERAGDLAFFCRPGEPASHVGIALGGSFFAHSRGRISIASMDPDNPLCDKDLLPQFMGWFRPRSIPPHK